MADTAVTPDSGDDSRLPYEAPVLTRHDDWEIVTGSTPSGFN